MKDSLSGRIDLGQLFDPQRSLGGLDALALRGASTARNAQARCVALGAPRFDEPAAQAAQSREGDAAAFLVMWDKYGVDALARVRGGYAVAIADAAKASLVLGVDRFAAQTLCYRLEGEDLAFSDRADCVAGHAGEIDSQAIFDFLFFHMIPAPRTIFSKVQRLPAAHCLIVDRGGARLKRYWQLDFDEKKRQPFDSAREQFRGLVREAVAEEVAGASQVGAFLSGGTDSSTVAGMLGQVTGAPARTYSIGFEAEGYDEMEYARIAARHFGCEHREYYVTPADLLASIPAVAQHHDQPFGNSSALPSYYCAKMAKDDGCTKLLAGDGGDELFGGNSRYAVQRVFELYQSVPGPLRRAIEPMCGDGSVLRRIPGLKQATGYVRHSRVPMPDRLQTFNLIMRLDPAKVLTADFLARVDCNEPSRHMRSTWQECHADSLINRMLAYDWRYTLADSDLPKVRGAVAMAGVEVGYPLLADRLVDFSMALEPEWKLKRFKLRWFFKEALRGFLPDAIITKKKHGFGLPYGPWMARNADLRALARDSLQGLVERGIVQAPFVGDLLGRHLDEHPGYYGEMVWILMMLEQWLRGQGNVQVRAVPGRV